MIFVADVLVDSGEGPGSGPAKVAIVEPLQNVPEGLKEVVIDTMAGTSCYVRLEAGARYVIFTRAPRYFVGSCSYTFRLAGNEHILDAIRSRLNRGELSLVGSVFKSTGRISHEGGVSTAVVELWKGESRFTATTDGAGRYSIPGLEPGRYQLRVSRDGYVADEDFNNRWSGRLELNRETNRNEPVKEPPGEIVIPANSCVIRDLAMWPAGSIRGVVRGVGGKAAAGVPVQAFGFNHRGERESSPLRTGVSDAAGKYQIQPLPAGKFVVGVNARTYDDDNPYPPTLYAEGRHLYLSESGSLDGIDLAVPAPRTPAQLRVQVFGPDGKPFKGGAVRLDTPAGVQRWYSGNGGTDANGEVVAPVYVGQRYQVSIHHYEYKNGRYVPMVGVAAVEVTGRETAVRVELKVVQERGTD